MARRAPASCSPCAMDQAILRLLATPNTTATRPSRLKGIRPPGWKLEREKDISGVGLRASFRITSTTRPDPAALLGALLGLAAGRACWLLLRIQPRAAAGVSDLDRKIVSRRANLHRPWLEQFAG